MKTKVKGKLLAILMSLAMAFTMMPVTGQMVYAAENNGTGKALREVSCDYLKGAQAENVYFGRYPQSEITSTEGLTQDDYVTYNEKNYRLEPIKWRVIYDKGKNYWLMSDKLLDKKRFQDSGVPVAWMNCSLRSWLNTDFYNQAFSENEKLHIAETTIDSESNVIDNLFLMSMSEVKDTAIGFEDTYGDSAIRKAQTTDYYIAKRGAQRDYDLWWLRTPGIDASENVDYSKASYCSTTGALYNKEASVNDNNIGVRPAMNLKGASILFQALADGGKNNVETGKIKVVGESTTCNDWRLTLLDNGRAAFKAEESFSPDENQRIVFWSNAKTGDNEYLSVIVKDIKTGEITHYGRVKALTTEDNGKITLDLTGIDQKGKRVYVFNEHYDPKEAVDYSSGLKGLKTKIAAPTGKTLTYNGKAQKGVADGTGYTLSGSSATNAGTYKATATLQEGYIWGDRSTEPKIITWIINKAANPLAIKGKTVKIKKAKVKKKTQKLAVGKVIAFTKKGQGKMTYTKASGNKKITIAKTTGKVTVKKGLKKGTYKVKVKVKAAGNTNYNASAVKTVTFKIKVK